MIACSSSLTKHILDLIHLLDPHFCVLLSAAAVLHLILVLGKLMNWPLESPGNWDEVFKTQNAQDAIIMDR